MRHYVRIITGPGTSVLGRGESGFLNFRRSYTSQSLMHLCSGQMWGECLGHLPRWVEPRSETVLLAVDSSIPRKFPGMNWCSRNICEINTWKQSSVMLFVPWCQNFWGKQTVSISFLWLQLTTDLQMSLLSQACWYWTYVLLCSMLLFFSSLH